MKSKRETLKDRLIKQVRMEQRENEIRKLIMSLDSNLPLPKFNEIKNQIDDLIYGTRIG